MFTNKHVIIAMIVAPILSILAWVAVGNLTGEQAAPAKAGQAYPLVEKSDCRWESGECNLVNADFELAIEYEEASSGLQLVLRSSHALEGVALDIGLPDNQGQPDMMRAADGQGLEWHIAIGGRPTPQERIRLVARAGGSTWFADVSTMFLQPRERPQLER